MFLRERRSESIPQTRRASVPPSRVVHSRHRLPRTQRLFPRQDRSEKPIRAGPSKRQRPGTAMPSCGAALVPHAGTRPGILNFVRSGSDQIAVHLRTPKAPGVRGDGVNPAQPSAAEDACGTGGHPDSRHVGGRRNGTRRDSIDVGSCRHRTSTSICPVTGYRRRGTGTQHRANWRWHQDGTALNGKYSRPCAAGRCRKNRAASRLRPGGHPNRNGIDRRSCTNGPGDCPAIVTGRREAPPETTALSARPPLLRHRPCRAS